MNNLLILSNIWITDDFRKKFINAIAFVFVIYLCNLTVKGYFNQNLMPVRAYLAGIVFLLLFIFNFLTLKNLFILFVLSLPLEATAVIEKGFTFRQSYIYSIIIFFIVLALRPRFIRKSPIDKVLWLFFFVQAASIIVTVFYVPPKITLMSTLALRGSELRYIAQMFYLFIVLSCFYAPYWLIRNEKTWFLGLRLYSIAMFVVSLYSIYQVFAYILNLPFKEVMNSLNTGGSLGSGQYEEAGFMGFLRPRGTYQEPLCLAHALLSIMPIFLCILLFSKGNELYEKIFKKRTMIIMTGCYFASFILTLSRGPWIGFVFGAVVMMAFAARHKQRVKFVSITLIIVVLIIIVFANIGAFKQVDILTLLKGRTDVDTYVNDPRVEYFMAMINIWKGHEIFGVGLGNYAYHGSKYFNANVLFSPHGVFWQALVETGLIGFVVVVMLVLSIFVFTYKGYLRSRGTVYEPIYQGFIFSYIGLLTEHLFSLDRFLPSECFIFALIFSLNLIVNYKMRNEKEIALV